MNLWERIARGQVRLSRFEDATVWRMRAEGKSWDEVEAWFNTYRQNLSLQGGANGRA